MVRMYQNKTYDYYCQIVGQKVCDVHYIHELLFSQVLNIKANKNVLKRHNYLIPSLTHLHGHENKINKCML